MGEMMNNWLGLLLSYILIGFILLGILVLERLKIKRNIIRKLIHIAIGNWWIIAMWYFDHLIFALIPPITFLIGNLLSRKYHLIKAMEADQSTLGTIYYPIAMIILTIICFGIIKLPHVGLIGMLCLAYGDGLASLIGKQMISPRLHQKKTFAGTLCMFFVSFLASTLVLTLQHQTIFIPALILALLSTLLELFSPKGLDNITVPIGVSLFYYYLFYSY